MSMKQLSSTVMNKSLIEFEKENLNMLSTIHELEDNIVEHDTTDATIIEAQRKLQDATKKLQKASLKTFDLKSELHNEKLQSSQGQECSFLWWGLLTGIIVSWALWFVQAI